MFLCCLFGQLWLYLSVNTNLKYRTILFYKTYFEKFFDSQTQKVKDKIIWTLTLIEEIKVVPEIYLKHIEGTDGIYEIRVQQGKNIFRIFCFFDKDKIIVLANAFQKKKQKTSKNEILKALKIKQEYFNEQKKYQNS